MNGKGEKTETTLDAGFRINGNCIGNVKGDLRTCRLADWQHWRTARGNGRKGNDEQSAISYQQAAGAERKGGWGRCPF